MSYPIFSKLFSIVDGLSLRERAMLVVIGSFIPFILLDHFYLQANQAGRDQQVSQIFQLRKQILDIKTNEQKIRLRSTYNPDEDHQQQIDKLADQVNRLNQRLHDFTAKFIPPKKVPETLKTILGLQEWLQFKRLTHLDPIPLFKPSRIAENNASDKGKDDTTNNNSLTSQETGDGNVFMHTFILEFSGSYLSTLNFLEHMETLPWKIYWENLEITMENYPTGEVTLTFQTLSLQKNIMEI